MTIENLLRGVARKARSGIERALYVGDNVTCNVCHRSSRSWLRGKSMGRCPSCRCATRTRVLWWYVSQANRLVDKRTLHFAPEAPLERNLRSERLSRYVTADYRNPKADIQLDIQALPFGDGEFDLILCSHVLEHIHDDRLAMKELRRVCSASGSVLIMVPQSSAPSTVEDLSSLTPEVRRARFGEIDHLREYGQDLCEILTSAGFSVVSFSPAEHIPSATRARYGLAADQTIFVCSP